LPEALLPNAIPPSLVGIFPPSLFFWAILGFELRVYTLSHSTNSSWRVSWTICLGWLQTDPPDLCLLSN
jgi:hypothetical protein